MTIDVIEESHTLRGILRRFPASQRTRAGPLLYIDGANLQVTFEELLLDLAEDQEIEVRIRVMRGSDRGR